MAQRRQGEDIGPAAFSAGSSVRLSAERIPRLAHAIIERADASATATCALMRSTFDGQRLGWCKRARARARRFSGRDECVTCLSYLRIIMTYTMRLRYW